MGYIQILRKPGLAGIVLSAGLARLPVGINSLGVLLYVQEHQSSFGVAGLVVSAVAVGGAVGGPLQGRLIDRRGLRPLYLIAAFYGLAVVLLLLACGERRPVPIQLIAGLFFGATLPVANSALRASWSSLLRGREDLLAPAFALDSLLIELSLVLGPVITAASVAVSGAGVAMVLSGVLGVFGSIVFTAILRHRLPVVPTATPEHRRRPLGALSSPGIRALTLASIPLGFYLGSLDIAIPALSETIGRPALAGVLLAILALSSGTAVLLYGLWQPGSYIWDIHLRFSLGLAFAGLPLLAFASAPAAAAALVLAGAPIAPLIASRNQLVREVAPPGTESEAFTWPLTAMICGISLGTGIGGQLVDGFGWRAPIVAAAAAAMLGVLSLFVFGKPAQLGFRSGAAET